ncbi:ATP-dependent RNA helicase ddx55 [Quaeritorhiza haematococci]|nr:ATP-dependent RNA helicase ddx55 [Quaeritorhiza haematococci]
MDTTTDTPTTNTANNRSSSPFVTEDFVGESARKMNMEDRDLFEKSTKAFVSWVRSYTEHQASYIFRFKDIDAGSLARAFGLLKLPKMPELQNREIDFVPVDMNTDTIKYKDKAREKQRLKKMSSAQREKMEKDLGKQQKKKSQQQQQQPTSATTTTTTSSSTTAIAPSSSSVNPSTTTTTTTTTAKPTNSNKAAWSQKIAAKQKRLVRREKRAIRAEAILKAKSEGRYVSSGSKRKRVEVEGVGDDSGDDSEE